jgi:hypothetical protein
VRIDTFGIYNVRDFIWPSVLPSTEDRAAWLKHQWKMHEDNLRHLEETNGVYVFGDASGRDHPTPIECKLLHFRLLLQTKSIADTFVELPVRYSGVPSVRLVREDGTLILESTLAHGESLSAYDVDGTGVSVQRCKAQDYADTKNEFVKSCTFKYYPRKK